MKKILTALVLTFFLLFLAQKSVLAQDSGATSPLQDLQGDDGCENEGIKVCIDKYPEAGSDAEWLCLFNHCTLNSKYLKAQKERTTCFESGAPSTQCFIGGTNKQQNGSNKDISGILDGIVFWGFNNFVIDVPVNQNGITTLTELKQNINKSPLVFLGKTIDSISRPPVSGAGYFADLGQRMGIVPKAYAQGIGFTGLQPLLPFWKIFRNLSYALLSVVMIFLGLMIMLRAKIDPKTVINVQNAIPKIVTSLILITFSYAIAGLIIDILYVLMAVFFYSFSFFGKFSRAEMDTAFNIAVSKENLGDFIAPFSDWFGRAWTSVPKITGVSGGLTGIFTSILSLAALILPFVGMPGWGLVAGVAGAGVGLLFQLGFLIVFIMLYGFLIQTAFMFIRNYLQILFYTVLGPIFILFSAIPSKDNNSTGGWFKTFLTSALVFPVAGVIMQLGLKLAEASSNLWRAPYLAGGNESMVKGAIIIGTIAMLPQVEALVKAFVESKTPQINIGLQGYDAREMGSVFRDPLGQLGLKDVSKTVAEYGKMTGQNTGLSDTLKSMFARGEPKQPAG